MARSTKSVKKKAEAEVSFLGLHLSQPHKLSSAELAKVLVPWIIGLLVYGTFFLACGTLGVILFIYIANTADDSIPWRDWYLFVTGSILAASGMMAGITAWSRGKSRRDKSRRDK